MTTVLDSLPDHLRLLTEELRAAGVGGVIVPVFSFYELRFSLGQMLLSVSESGLLRCDSPDVTRIEIGNLEPGSVVDDLREALGQMRTEAIATAMAADLAADCLADIEAAHEDPTP